MFKCWCPGVEAFVIDYRHCKDSDIVGATGFGESRACLDSSEEEGVENSVRDDEVESQHFRRERKRDEERALDGGDCLVRYFEGLEVTTKNDKRAR